MQSGVEVALAGMESFNGNSRSPISFIGEAFDMLGPNTFCLFFTKDLEIAEIKQVEMKSKRKASALQKNAEIEE